jgi:hypothetical protein
MTAFTILPIRGRPKLQQPTPESGVATDGE